MKVSEALARIKKSDFRSSFHLSEGDMEYINDKGMAEIEKHAQDFVRKRLAPAYIPNDGRQTPMKGHPVFKAQHACACCCRGCFEKWYHVPKGRELTEQEQRGVVKILMAWIAEEMKKGSTDF